MFVISRKKGFGLLQFLKIINIRYIQYTVYTFKYFNLNIIYWNSNFFSSLFVVKYWFGCCILVETGLNALKTSWLKVYWLKMKLQSNYNQFILKAYNPVSTIKHINNFDQNILSINNTHNDYTEEDYFFINLEYTIYKNYY